MFNIEEIPNKKDILCILYVRKKAEKNAKYKKYDVYIVFKAPVRYYDNVINDETCLFIRITETVAKFLDMRYQNENLLSYNPATYIHNHLMEKLNIENSISMKEID